MYKPETKCSKETELRMKMAAENYAGHGQAVTMLSYALTDHRKTCPVCQGVPLVDILFGVKVVIAEVYHDA